MTTVSSTFVLISNDAMLARALTTALSNRASLTVVPTAEQALPLIKSRPSVTGIVLDQAALGTDTLRTLDRMRAARPLAAIVLIVAKLEVSMLNALQPLRVSLLVRPLPADALAQYAERALEGGRLRANDVKLWVARLSSDRRLSAGDRALIPLVLDHETPEVACHRLGLDRAALDRGLRRIVKKCGVRNTDRLARNLWRDALLFSRPGAGDWLESPKLSAAV